MLGTEPNSHNRKYSNRTKYEIVWFEYRTKKKEIRAEFILRYPIYKCFKLIKILWTFYEVQVRARYSLKKFGSDSVRPKKIWVRNITEYNEL